MPAIVFVLLSALFAGAVYTTNKMFREPVAVVTETIENEPPRENPERLRMRATEARELKIAIEKMQDARVFGDIRVLDGVGYAIVASEYYHLTKEDRVFAAKTALEWCKSQDQDCERLILNDFSKGKRIGEYTSIFGMRLD